MESVFAIQGMVQRWNWRFLGESERKRNMASGKYKLLLVDDERDVLEAISAAVPWEKYDIQLVVLCDNAIEALKQIQRETPDLVITDVKMPVVNGIELIFQARQQGCDAEFIVLSGFDEFEFAQ